MTRISALFLNTPPDPHPLLHLCDASLEKDTASSPRSMGRETSVNTVVERYAGLWMNTRCFLSRGDSRVHLGSGRKYLPWQGAGSGWWGLTS